ncbi:hypothetical protein D1871_08980 [Nakamurella silvestris]|nr:hypothetical protein D1871_08980 [Nakamurella silvestris]
MEQRGRDMAEDLLRPESVRDGIQPDQMLFRGWYVGVVQVDVAAPADTDQFMGADLPPEGVVTVPAAQGGAAAEGPCSCGVHCPRIVLRPVRFQRVAR